MKGGVNGRDVYRNKAGSRVFHKISLRHIQLTGARAGGKWYGPLPSGRGGVGVPFALQTSGTEN